LSTAAGWAGHLGWRLGGAPLPPPSPFPRPPRFEVSAASCVDLDCSGAAVAPDVAGAEVGGSVLAVVEVEGFARLDPLAASGAMGHAGVDDPLKFRPEFAVCWSVATSLTGTWAWHHGAFGSSWSQLEQQRRPDISHRTSQASVLAWQEEQVMTVADRGRPWLSHGEVTGRTVARSIGHGRQPRSSGPLTVAVLRPR